MDQLFRRRLVPPSPRPPMPPAPAPSPMPPAPSPSPRPGQRPPIRRPIVQPIIRSPIYTQPIYTQPIYQQPIYQQPIYQPSYGCEVTHPVAINCSASYVDDFGNNRFVNEQVRAQQCPTQLAQQQVCAGLLSQHRPYLADPRTFTSSCRLA